MATLYNKTALKKIRKKELVQMFLDKQAREINYSMEDEIEELKNDLRLCAEGLIPHGMVGGIVECEREKRHKAEEENKNLKEKLERVTSVRDDFADTCASLNTALEIIGADPQLQQDMLKEEIDERVDDRGELDNDKLLKILYEFFNVDEDED